MVDAKYNGVVLLGDSSDDADEQSDCELLSYELGRKGSSVLHLITGDVSIIKLLLLKMALLLLLVTSAVDTC